MVKIIISSMCLIAALSRAEMVVVVDARYDQPQATTLRVIELHGGALTPSEKELIEGCDLVRRLPTPSIIDTTQGIGVTITGSVKQAEVDLARLQNQQPDTAEKTLLKKLVKRLARDNELTEEDLALVSDLFPPIVPDIAYKSNDFVRVDGALVAIAEDHIPSKPGKPGKPIALKPIRDESKYTK